MDPSFTEFVKLLQGGGNVALIAAAWMLWKAVNSLTRIEVFMATLFEVLLRADGIQIREADRERLRDMQSRLNVKDKQGGFVVMKFLQLLGIALVLALAGFSGYAQAQEIPTDAARVRWQNATTLCLVTATSTCAPGGAAIPAPPDPLSLSGTTIQRSVECTTASFGTVAQTLNVTPDVLVVLFENLRPAGKHCFRARHTQTSGDTSGWSAVVSKVIAIPQPPKTRPPTITIE